MTALAMALRVFHDRDLIAMSQLKHCDSYVTR